MALKPDSSWRGEDDLTYRVGVWEDFIDAKLIHGQDMYDTAEGYSPNTGQGYVDHFYVLEQDTSALPKLSPLGWQLLEARYVKVGWNRLMHSGPDTRAEIKLVDREFVE